jgi:hypothetical protein
MRLNKKKDIVAVGSIAFDSIKTPSGSKDRILGGSLTHFINAATVIKGLNIGIVGVVGKDFTAKEEQFFIHRKVDLSDVQRKEGLSFFWEGYYQDDLNQAFTVKTELNVFADFNPSVCDRNSNCKILFLGNIDPVLQLGITNKVSADFIVLDTMNFWIESKKEDLLQVINKIDCLIINEGEAALLTGEKNFITAADTLLGKGLSYLIIKRGNAGVTLFGKDGFRVSYPAVLVDNVIDPTGAGDSFAGGFVSYLAKNKSKKLNHKLLKKSLVYATLVASFNVQGFGTDKISSISKKDVDKLYDIYNEISAFPKIK